MRYILTSLLILLLMVSFASKSHACDYPTPVEAGAVVGCKGVILSEDQFIEASNAKKKIRLQDLKIAQYEGMEELYEIRHKHYVRELDKTRGELEWLQIKSNIGYVISFSLGAIITGAIAKEVLK